jgi:hypothetical protein
MSGALSKAEVAELADAHGSGPCTRKGVGVRVPSSAPNLYYCRYAPHRRESIDPGEILRLLLQRARRVDGLAASPSVASLQTASNACAMVDFLLPFDSGLGAWTASPLGSITSLRAIYEKVRVWASQAIGVCSERDLISDDGDVGDHARSRRLTYLSAPPAEATASALCGWFSICSFE